MKRIWKIHFIPVVALVLVLGLCSAGLANSNKAKKHYPALAKKPIITGYAEKCMTMGSKLTILGINFGTEHAKRLLLGGHGISVKLTAISWSDTKIVAMVPHDLRIASDKLYYVGVQQNKPGWLWISNINQSIRICQ
jgi:hypothetical protein